MNWQRYRKIKVFSVRWHRQTEHTGQTLLFPEVATSCQLKMIYLNVLYFVFIQSQTSYYLSDQWQVFQLCLAYSMCTYNWIFSIYIFPIISSVYDSIRSFTFVQGGHYNHFSLRIVRFSNSKCIYFTVLYTQYITYYFTF